MSVKTVPPAAKPEWKLKDRLLAWLYGPAFETALLWAVSFVSGVFSARAVVFGKYAPFGVAVAAAVPRRGLAAAVLGTLLGYLLPSPVYVPVRYIAAAAAAACLRWALGDIKRLVVNPAFAPLVAFLPLVFTGLTAGLVGNAFAGTYTMYVAESFLGAGAAYFLQRAGGLFTNRRGISTLEVRDIACLAVYLGVAALALEELTLWDISLGKILLVWVVLLAARLGGLAGGAVAGIAAGTLLGLSGGGLTPVSGALGLGGLLAGAFMPMGKVAGAAAFFLASTVGSLQVGAPGAVLSHMAEAALGGALYVVVPVSRRLETLFSPRKDGLATAGLRRTAVLKLDYAADALQNVNETVGEIAEKLAAVCAPDIDNVYRRASSEVCAGCGLHAYCWEKNRPRTDAIFQGLTPVLREKGAVKNEDFGSYFAEHCGRAGDMREAVNARYGEFLTREAAQLRAVEVKNAVEE